MTLGGAGGVIVGLEDDKTWRGLLFHDGYMTVTCMLRDGYATVTFMRRTFEEGMRLQRVNRREPLLRRHRQQRFDASLGFLGSRSRKRLEVRLRRIQKEEVL